MMEWNDETGTIHYFERIDIKVKPRIRNRVRRPWKRHKKWWWPFWGGVCVGLYGLLYWLVRGRVL